MGWFDEQIKERKLNDEELFSQAFVELTGAVLGNKYVAAFRDSRLVTKDAFDEILKYYHVKSRELPSGITELADQLEFLLHPHGIMRRVVELTAGWHKNAFGAMLGRLRDDGRIVALIPSGMHGYVYTDPDSGKKVRITGKTEERFELDAIAFYKSFPLRPLVLNDLIVYMMSQISASDIAWISFTTLLMTLVGMLAPRLTAFLTGEVIEVGSIKLLLGAAVFYICVTITTLILNVCKNLYNNRISRKISATVEAATMMRILSLPADFFKNYSSGELATYMGQIGTLCSNLTDMVFSLGITSLFSLLYIGQIFRYAPALVRPSLVIIVLTVLLSVINAVFSMSHTRKEIKLSAKESGLSFALITGIQKIKLAGAEKRAFANWAKAKADAARATYRLPLLITINPALISGVGLVGEIVIYFYAIASSVTASEFYAFNVAYAMTMAAFTSLVSIATVVSQIKPFLDTARPILDAEPEMSENKHVVTRLYGGIELDNVSFRYSDSMPNVIDGLSLKIKSGEYVAIVGETGCGKSTLLRLLLGFEKPQRGAVYYDGKDINSLDLKSLRHNIGVVTQNGKLFQGDIFSNIIISSPMLTLEDAWEAANLAGIAEDIAAMPMGMNTVISEGQGGISGGQKQRLMIARAIAPKPKILMFDEATSALDNITQKRVSESLDSLKCTRIVIAHRLSTIKQCDRIIMLAGGHIVEEGTYDELIALNGRFAELVERQRV